MDTPQIPEENIAGVAGDCRRGDRPGVYGRTVNPFRLGLQWLFQIFSENENGRYKASFSRVFGAYVIISIIMMAQNGKEVPDAMMTMFWVLIGYQFLSKALGSVSPALLDYAKAAVLRAPTQPKP